MRIAFVSDTHGLHKRITVPEADVLVHCGDLTGRGDKCEIESAAAWLRRLPHKHKVAICGNHDWCFQDELAPYARQLLADAGVTYLEDDQTTIEGVKFYGTPWQPEFCSWAFNLPRGPALAAKWAMIPQDTDVLITHGPPFGYGDMTERGERVGCEDLTERLRVVQPSLHAFGHIHEDYGIHSGLSSGILSTLVNCSNLDLRYRVANRPLVFDLLPLPDGLTLKRFSTILCPPE